MPRLGLVPLHPSDDPSPQHFLLEHLARALPPHGIAVERFERRAAASPDLDVPFHDQAADARRVAGVLRERLDVPVGYWGFSQGGWPATIAAASDPAAAFLVTVSAPGVSPAEQMRYGTREQMRRLEFGASDVRDALELRGLYESYLRDQAAREDLQASIAAAAGAAWFELARVPRDPPAPGQWVDMDHDPAPVVEAVGCPILAFFGEEDEWVPVQDSVARWRAHATAPIDVVHLPGTTHEPTLGGRSRISPLYEETLIRWLGDL